MRLKWVSYHLVSNVGAVLATGAALFFLFPSVIQIDANTTTLVIFSFIAVTLSFLIAVVAGFYSSRDTRKGLEEVSIGAKNLAYGNLNYRLKLMGNSDFDAIVLAFNEMATRLESQVGALQKLAQENEQLLQETKITAISEERQRLARDLHDAVSQQLFAISMMASTATKIAEKKPSQTLELIKEISLAASRAQAEMRALLLQLRPLTLQNESLAQALASLAAELQSRQTVQCHVELDPISLPKNMENQLFRIAQEGLSNVLRHAEASQVQILLKMSEGNRRVLFTIEDNGKGFDPETVPKSSIGIRSIKERSTLIGGTAQWLTVLGQGTKLEIRIPISIESDLREVSV